MKYLILFVGVVEKFSQKGCLIYVNVKMMNNYNRKTSLEIITEKYNKYKGQFVIASYDYKVKRSVGIIEAGRQ